MQKQVDKQSQNSGQADEQTKARNVDTGRQIGSKPKHENQYVVTIALPEWLIAL